MIKQASNLWRIANLVLLVVLFLIIVIAYFFIYQKYSAKPDIVAVSSEPSSLTAESLSDKHSLTLQADVKRFLDVYFSQEFSSSEQKADFIQKEYVRFLDYSASNEADQELIIKFISYLNKIVSQVNAGQTDFSEINNQLMVFYNSI